MPMMDSANLIDQLDHLALDATRNFSRLQDFQVFTGHSYDHYSKMVAAGHIKESVHNVRTDTRILSTDLAQVLLGYLDQDLITNEIYLRKAGALARASVGEPLPIPRSYVYDGAGFLKDFIARTVASARRRFKTTR